MTGAQPLAPIAITMGEPAGIGGEITLKLWQARTSATPPFFIIDDPDRLAGLARMLKLDVPIQTIADPESAAGVFTDALPVLARTLAAAPRPGVPDSANGVAVIGAIRCAVELVLAGRAGAIVTNPVHKATLYRAGFTHPGQTEFLAELGGTDRRPVMMLACPELRVVPVTIHQPLARAIADLSTDSILACGITVAAALQRDFAIAEPVLAVAALNPHAGEDGHLGHEETDIIAPAVAALRRQGIDASGPWPADSLFHAGARRSYDAVLCMYHDQALLPLKTMDFHGGVNVTLGLPFVRCSPDHGTAFDIAGTGCARADSLAAAVRMADEMARRRHAATDGMARQTVA